MKKNYSMLPVIVVWCLCLSFFVGLWEWTDRNIEYICTRVSGHEVKVHGAWTLIATLTGPCVVLFNVGTEIYAATEKPDDQD